MFLRELPEPICTFECYDMFLSTSKNPDEKEKKLILKKVLTYLPTANRKSKKIEILILKHSFITFMFNFTWDKSIFKNQ